MSVKDFFAKLFGMGTSSDNDRDELKEPKYNIEILSCEEVSEFKTPSKNKLAESEMNEVFLVECVVDGTKGKYLQYDYDKLCNYDSLIVPKDTMFIDNLTWAISDWRDELEQKKCQALFVVRAKKIKEVLEAKKSLSANVISDAVIVSPELTVNPPAAKTKLSNDEFVSKMVDNSIKQINSQEITKSEKADEPLASKKKGGRPKKEVG